MSNMKTSMHIKFKQYRVIYVVVTVFFLWLGYDAWEWFKTNSGGLSQAAAAGFISIYLAVIGALKYILENLRQDSEHDKEDL